MKLAISKQYQNFLRQARIDLDELFPRLDHALFSQNGMVDLSMREFYQMVQRFDQEISEEHRELSQVSQTTIFVPTYLAVLLDPNGYEAIRRFATYQALVCPNYLLVEEDSPGVTVRIISPLGIKSLTKFAVLNTQLLLTQFLREGIGERIFPQAVTSSLAYDEKTCQELGNVQEVKIGNSITFSKEDLEKPFVTQNERTWSMLEPEV